MMNENPAERRKVAVEEALALLPTPEGQHFAAVLERGSLLVEIYVPPGIDGQTPHVRDEIYIVIKGSGEFVNGSERHTFLPGDLLFVPAGVFHRFENFTDDLAVWVIFYGEEKQG